MWFLILDFGFNTTPSTHPHKRGGGGGNGRLSLCFFAGVDEGSRHENSTIHTCKYIYPCMHIGTHTHTHMTAKLQAIVLLVCENWPNS